MTAAFSHELGLLKASEEHLADALELIASRHQRDAGIRDMAPKLATWSREHLEQLKPFAGRYKATPSQHPARVRSSLLYGMRAGALGLFEDLQDLSLLVRQAGIHWTSVDQAAMELRDDELMTFSKRALDENEQQAAWLETMIKTKAPQTLTVKPNTTADLSAAMPRSPSVAAIPDPIWAPVVGGLLLVLVGLLGVLAGRPWLLPSLGPTAYLQAATPTHPASRAYNTIVGHVIGLLSGFAAVAVFNVWSAPVVLTDHQLVVGRVLAAGLALALTILIAELAQASHPPAGATALLVALGSIATLTDAGTLVMGAVILAALGEGAAYVRARARRPAAT